MLSGIDGVLLVVVIGEGKLVVPVDFAIRGPTLQALERHAVTNCAGCRACSEGVSELWICYPLTDEETPQAERGER